MPEFTPLVEDHPFAPISPYATSKLMVENMLMDFDRAYNFKSVRFRYFNAAGADPQGRLGEDHEPETHLIPLILLTALGRWQWHQQRHQSLTVRLGPAPDSRGAGDQFFPSTTH